MDYSATRFEPARRKGWLAREMESGFEDSLVGMFIAKYPGYTKALDILQEVIGEYPTFANVTERSFEKARAVMEDRCSSRNSIRVYMAYFRSIISSGCSDILTRKMREVLSVRKEPTKSIYLTEHEVGLLEDVYCISDEERYVKYNFLISCVTGCRHSDAVGLSELNISGGTFSYVARKTKSDTSMPAHSKLAHYISQIPKGIRMWDARYNLILRNLCRSAGINGKVRVYHAGREQTGEKWQFVSSHTARRSFATNVYLRGCDIHGLSRMMGHSSAVITENYLCSVQKPSESVMDFFKGNK